MAAGSVTVAALRHRPRQAMLVVALAAVVTGAAALGPLYARSVEQSVVRNVVQEVLNEIAGSKEWTRHYMVKLRLVSNPRTPFGHASKFVLHMRESDLAKLAKSKEVPGAVQTACRQQLQRKGKV